MRCKIADTAPEETRGYAGRTLWINFTLTKGAMFAFNSVLVALGHTVESIRSDIIHRLKKEAVEMADVIPTGWAGLNESVPVLNEVFIGQPLRVLVGRKEGRDRQEVIDHRPWPEGVYLKQEDTEGNSDSNYNI